MRPKNGAWTIRPVTEEEFDLVAGLLAAASWQHRHLDWATPEALLGRQPYLLAIEEGLPIACLACPPDPPQVTWIRLFAVASGYDLATCWTLLWQQARTRLQAGGVKHAAALAIPTWLPRLAEESGFERIDSVMFLEWDAGEPQPQRPERPPIAPLLATDLTAVARLDQRAFEPLWQHSLESLQLALSQADYSTVYRQDGAIAAYQISTASAHGGHLARLAVDPPYQGRGIASALVADVLGHFSDRGLPRVTVNTQGANERGLSLYRRLGFRPTGQSFPVYHDLLTS